MRWTEYINADEVRKTIACLHSPGDVFEVRAIGTSKKDVLSAYFKDVEMLFKATDSIDMRSRNLYVTINQIKPGCFFRAQSNHFLKTDQTTSDTDIEGYRWLFVDLDPVRTSGISSSNSELTAAKVLAKKVYEYLKYLGFEEPIKALSGNGCHLLYRISVKNDDAGRKLVEKCLKTLSILFNTDEVTIDTTNSNPSRICKLHGTMAQKGTSTEERPHRMSRIFSIPEPLNVTKAVFLEKLVAELPEEEWTQPQQYGKSNSGSYSYALSRYSSPGFDLQDFLSRYGLTYREGSTDRARMYLLDECPFNASHRNGDAKIFQYPNGAIAFKCHHNSCHELHWQDLRRKFEPMAYEQSTDYEKYEQGWQQHNRDKTEAEVPYIEKRDVRLAFRNAKQIYEDPEPEYEYLKSGITVIDERLHGLQKTALTVISGTRGSGKSTLIGQIIAQALKDEHVVVCYSGELNNKKYLKWLIRQIAGKNHVTVSAKGAFVSDEDTKRIVDWMGDRFWLYDNRYGNNFKEIEVQLREKLKEHKADLCIIDNLMALDLSKYNSKDTNAAQTSFVWALKNLAELTNTHVIFVAHPRKPSGFIRMDDISGTGNIGNIVDNALMVHRHNQDFRKAYNDLFKRDPVSDGINENVTNVIEIAKDREFGTQDVFIPLYFEESTKRLKNSEDEYVTYGWEPEADSGFVSADEFDDIPF